MNPASLSNLLPNRRRREEARAPAPLTKLKAWRKSQMVEDPATKVRRPMKLTDVPRLYSIAPSTWHQWEQPVGHPQFKRPNAANMARLCGEITHGAVTYGDFYDAPETAPAVDTNRGGEGG